MRASSSERAGLRSDRALACGRDARVRRARPPRARAAAVRAPPLPRILAVRRWAQARAARRVHRAGVHLAHADRAARRARARPVLHLSPARSYA
jgi:hypothetical protein